MTTDKTVRTEADMEAKIADAAVPRRTFVPSVEAYETKDVYVLELDLPGADEKDIEVTVENGILAVKADTAAEVQEGMTILREEVPARRWSRMFDLGDGVDVAGIKGRFSRGVLQLTLPKHEAVKARKIEIKGE